MKRTVMVLILVASAAALFANGNAEQPNAGDMTGPELTRSRDGFDGESMPPAGAVFTEVELTGTITMVDDHAVLAADGMTYLLSIPRIAWYAEEIGDGAVVTVTGNLVEGVDHDQVAFDGDGHIAVTQVEIDGEVFTVAGRGGPAGRADGLAQRGFDDDSATGRGSMSDDDWNGRRGAEDDDQGRGGRGRQGSGRESVRQGQRT